jgi:hypothetical protein
MAEPLWTISNCYLDPDKVMLRRVSAKLESEPIVAGRRLRIRDSIQLTQQEVEQHHDHIEALVKMGVIAVISPNNEDITDEVRAEAVPVEAAPVPPVEAQPEAEPEEAPEITTPGPSAEPLPLAPEQTAAKGKGRWGKRG